MAINYKNLNAGASNTTALLLQLINNIVNASAKEQQDQRNYDRLIESENRRVLDGEQKELDDNYQLYNSYMRTGQYGEAEGILNLMGKYENIPNIVMPMNLGDLSEEFINRRQKGNNEQMYFDMYKSGTPEEVVSASQFFKNKTQLEPHIQQAMSKFRETTYYRERPIYRENATQFTPDVSFFNTTVQPLSSVPQMKVLNPELYIKYYEVAKTMLQEPAANLEEQNKQIDEIIGQQLLPDLRVQANEAFLAAGHSYDDVMQGSDYQGKEAVGNFLTNLYNAEERTVSPNIAEDRLALRVANRLKQTVPSLDAFAQIKQEQTDITARRRELSTKRNELQSRATKLQEQRAKISPDSRFYGAIPTGQERIEIIDKELNPLRDELNKLDEELNTLLRQ